MRRAGAKGPMTGSSRAYYEQQGREAAAGGGIHCSEPQITEVVIAMARRHLRDARRIADVGCGANLDYDRALVEMGKHPIAIDFTFNFLSLAPRDERIPLVQGDALALPIGDGRLDAVICSETIEHIGRDDLAVAELARVLRPGGYLLLTVPNLWNASRLLEIVKTRDFAIRLMVGHWREYTPAGLRRLLLPYFTIEQWMPVGFGWKGPVGTPVEILVRSRFKRLSKSLAFVCRRRPTQ